MARSSSKTKPTPWPTKTAACRSSICRRNEKRTDPSLAEGFYLRDAAIAVGQLDRYHLGRRRQLQIRLELVRNRRRVFQVARRQRDRAVGDRAVDAEAQVAHRAAERHHLCVI